MSGDRLVYLDPQERIWPRDPGQCYSLSSVIGTDMLVPFNGIAGFNYRETTNYPKTLFRFPLRKKESHLSDNTYTPEALSELTDELIEEAKYLLVFLRSVHTVEVYDIPQLSPGGNKFKLIFRVKVASEDRDSLDQKRQAFLTNLKREYYRLKSFKISKCITDVARFDVKIIDHTAREQLATEQSVSWLVASQVGSSNTEVLNAAAKQRVFPWVGVAIELVTPTSSAQDVISGGRIFCFLPMPAETLSKLPVHVNGTFGLNDDRRTIKWPAKERRNDPTAQWNKMLVQHCLPSCYNLLLAEAVNTKSISSDLFYCALPHIDIVGRSYWKLTLEPLFESIFQWNCVWSRSCKEWVTLENSTVYTEGNIIPVVVERFLVDCGHKVVELPDHVYQALENFYDTDLLTVVSPRLLRQALRSNTLKYKRKVYEDKLDLLKYCLVDRKYSNLNRLELIPLANKSFQTFSKDKENKIYVCSKEFPSKLLPNHRCDGVLIDLKDLALQSSLSKVADSNDTQLNNLDEEFIAQLLPHCYPKEWNSRRVNVITVAKDDQEYSLNWFPNFWKWVQKYKLSSFIDTFIVPVATESVSRSLKVTRLTEQINSPVVLIRDGDCSELMLGILNKFGVLYTMSRYVHYFKHDHIYKFVNKYSPIGVLTAISNSCSNIKGVKLDDDEACELQIFLASLSQYQLTESQIEVLYKLRIFEVLGQSKRLSLYHASKSSWNDSVVVEPPMFSFSCGSIPFNLIILSRNNEVQHFLQACSGDDIQISFPSSQLDFILEQLIPMIKNNKCPDEKIDPLMKHVLQLIPMVENDDGVEKLCQLTSELATLAFVRVEHSSVRQAPQKLYDCTKPELKSLFEGKPVFPCQPYNDQQCIQPLRKCKLQSTVTGSTLYSLIKEIAKQCQDIKPLKVSIQCVKRSKAVLDYIRKHPCVLRYKINKQSMFPSTLGSALKEFSTNNCWLPICSVPPNDYTKCLEWKGRSCTSHFALLSDSIVLCSNQEFDVLPHIVGSQMYFVNCPSALCEELSGTTKPVVPIEPIFSHFKSIIATKNSIKKSQLDVEVDCLYKYLQEHLPDVQGTYQTSELCSQSLVWFRDKHTFVPPKIVACREHPTFGHASSLYPYFIHVPDDLLPYKKLLSHFGVQESLTNSDIVSVLKMIKDDVATEGNSASMRGKWVIVENVLNWLTNDGTKNASDKLDVNDTLFVPIDGQKLQLKCVNDVVYCDSEHLTDITANSLPFIHRKFGHLAPYLGVKPLRTSVIEQYETKEHQWTELPFGQHEDLTQRIRNILEEYPQGITLLKELLQNADDAKATKMYVILDKRMHDTKMLPSSEWQDLQGPALLVWNDSTFTDDDLKGIQKLGLGSKRSIADTIGQFGIGFNVVYHLTDCPSFFTNGNTLCVLDPHCRYVPNASPLKPGRQYITNDAFWNDWSDLKSAFLRPRTVLNCPVEVQTSGTLFRFPLRHTKELARKSKLVCGKHSRVGSTEGRLTANDMENNLTCWAPSIKEALLFLNNVVELKFFVINAASKMKLVNHYQAQLDRIAIQKRDEIKSIFSDYLEHKTPTVVNYPMCIVETTPNKSIDRWFIQQGVGDLQNPQQQWKYLPHKKPKHGLALPIKVNGFSAKLFCFLPLPSLSNLPIHVNGDFILDSARSGLWNTRDVTESDRDDRLIWNNNLLEAIASSYARLLVVCRDEFFSSEKNYAPLEFNKIIKEYYGVFPRWLQSYGNMQKEVQILSEFVYKKLFDLNPCILVGMDFSAVKFLPIVSDKSQSYFRGDLIDDGLSQILIRLGMTLTAAPMFIRSHFHHCGISLQVVTSETVFDYYCSNYSQVSEIFPCPISTTQFQSVNNFVKFVKFLLKEEHLEHEAGTFYSFPRQVNAIPLLLTSTESLCYISDDDKQKIINSRYSSIFTATCGDKFLHPEMCKLNLIPSYFVEPQKNNWDMISDILSATLPEQCRDVKHVEGIEIPELQQLWCCLKEDKVFSRHCLKIVKKWAILLTANDDLYSYRSKEQLLPVVAPCDVKEKCDSKVFDIIKKLRMPVLNSTVVNVDFCKRFEICPQISEPESILRNLYFLEQQYKILDEVDDSYLDDIIEILFSYFGRIHFRYDEYSLALIKSLPLFKDIDDNYCTLKTETYIWPSSSIPFSRGEVWMKKTSTVFLSPRGDWTILGDATVLGLCELSPLLVYTKYIFPHFDLLENEKRVFHLKILRDSEMFKKAWQSSKSKDNNRESIRFINALKQLPCLPKGENLHPIHDFCDPESPVLRLFLGDDSFPPDNLSERKWLNFFRKLGLRSEATQREFITFCSIVGEGRQAHIKEKSLALLENLFQNEDWHNDLQFLECVVEIPFVCAEPLEDLSWIVPVVDVDSTHQSIRLTSLSKSASVEVQNLVWTTMPVVQLPCNVLPETSNESEFGQITRYMRNPAVGDVIKNIVNISSSRFANIKLFDYSSRDCIPTSEDRKDLLFTVLAECFHYLSNCSKEALQCLQDAHCIPVYTQSDISSSDSSVIALVTPLQVVATDDADGTIKQLVPFLNPLHHRLFSVFPSFLSKLGITTEIQYSNLQKALQVMHDSIEQPLPDPNSLKIVKLILKRLYSCSTPELTRNTNLTTLYLPNAVHCLIDSKKLLYDDVGRYKNAQMDTKGSSYSILSLLTERLNERSEYGFNFKEFVNMLPKSLRPLPLSANCYEVLNSVCAPLEQFCDSELVNGLDTAFKFTNFSDVVYKIMLAFSTKEAVCKKFTDGLTSFCASVTVRVVPNLTVDVYLNLSDPPVKIGMAKVDFAILQDGDNEAFSLYINFGTKMKPKIFEAISSGIIATVAGECQLDLEYPVSGHVQTVIERLLQDQSQDEIAEIFGEYGVNTESIDFEVNHPTKRDFSVKIGKPIPEELHYRLFTDMYNVFRPQEIVGYEQAENFYVYARIEYRVSECHEDGELDKYVIIVDEDNEAGIEVTSVDLSKILRMKKVTNDSNSDSKEIVLYDPESEGVMHWDKVKDASLKSVLNKIYQELKKIWNITDLAVRRKAIKAMYLKWHPDKNPSQFATKAFQYLQHQIERLERGMDLQLPSGCPYETELQSDILRNMTRPWEQVFRRRREGQRREETGRSDPSMSDDLDEEVRANSVTADPYKAQVWWNQAQHDLTALQVLMREANTRGEVCAHVCFMAHQVAEKALKAGMYKLIGLHPSVLRWHQLVGHAGAIEQVKPRKATGLRNLVKSLESFYLDTRFPNRYTPDKVPSEQYSLEDAKLAEKTAKEVMTVIKNVF